jgi:hypothetical protein
MASKIEMTKMPKTELDEILATVEEIRLELHPEIGAAFMAAVVKAEELNPDDEAAAMRAIQDAVQLEVARQQDR